MLMIRELPDATKSLARIGSGLGGGAGGVGGLSGTVIGGWRTSGMPSTLLSSGLLFSACLRQLVATHDSHRLANNIAVCLMARSLLFQSPGPLGLEANAQGFGYFPPLRVERRQQTFKADFL